MSTPGREPGLDLFQTDVASIALRAIGPHGFALAGAGALVAHGLVTRLTEVPLADGGGRPPLESGTT